MSEMRVAGSRALRRADQPAPAGAVAAPLGPSHDLYALVAGLAADGAEAAVGVVALGEADLVRLRPRHASRLGLPLHGTAGLREVLTRVVSTTTRLTLVDLGDPRWGVAPRDPELCGITSLAVAPVQQNGRVVGVVGAADTLSRPWSSDELTHLADLARIVEHELATKARTAVADRVVRGWDELATRVDGTTRAVAALVRQAGESDDVSLRARASLVGGRLDSLAEDLHVFEGGLAPGREALTALTPVDLRWGVTAAVRTVATGAPDVRIRPRLHPDPLPALADPEAVRSGVIALLHAVTQADGTGEVLVRLELVPGSPEDATVGPLVRLRVDARGRWCTVSALTGAVGRFESLARRPDGGAATAAPSLAVVGEDALVRGRTVTGYRGAAGTRFETTWGVDVG